LFVFSTFLQETLLGWQVNKVDDSFLVIMRQMLPAPVADELVNGSDGFASVVQSISVLYCQVGSSALAAYLHRF
jgi:hypothetical protein